jgi:hypothetical protein
MPGPTRQPSVPDFDWLWRLYRFASSGMPSGRDDFPPVWRIPYSDWNYIRREGKGIGYPIMSGSDQRLTLFGVPVEVIADEIGRFPELAFVCDRRNAGTTDTI